MHVSVCGTGVNSRKDGYVLTCRTLSQLKRIARAMYSNPPVHGARIVAEVVNDESMFGEWKEEMEMMSGRIKTVRKLLHKELNELNSDRNWDFILSQIGMFSFTGVLSACSEQPSSCL
jgi:aspartate aminotransferase, chloroplastic